MEVANILFVIAFVGLPLAIGIWALVMRRQVRQRGDPRSLRRRSATPPRKPAQRAGGTTTARAGASAEQTTEVAAGDGAEQETTAMPRKDWASAVRPVRGQATTQQAPARRRFHPPRYAGRSAGVVKRVTPRAYRSFLRPRSSVPR